MGVVAIDHPRVNNDALHVGRLAVRMWRAWPPGDRRSLKDRSKTVDMGTMTS